MASTFLGLNIAYTGLQAAQTSINTTAHNVSNVNTEGYSKQQAVTTADNALRTYASYGTIGSGVVVTGISQLRDSYYDVKYRGNRSNFGEYEVKENYMTQIEDYLNEFALDGFTSEYNKFFTALKELQKTPTEAAAQNSVVNSAMSLSQYFNTLSTNLTNVQKDSNEEIKNQIGVVNTISQNIASLNKQINQIEANKGSANDLRDKRNLMLDKLSEIINVTTNEQEIGNGLTSFSVSINGQTLVDNNLYNKLTTQALETGVNASDAHGLYNIVWESGLEFNEYSDTLKGNLKGLIDIRDGNNGSVENVITNASGDKELTLTDNPENTTGYKGVPHYVSKLNEFINKFTTAVNDLLTSGYTADGKAGIPLFTVKYDNTAMAASSVTVNKELLLDSTKLATTTKPSNGEAYCDIVDKLMALEKAKVFEGGTGAYFLESVVAEVGIDSDKATSFLENYKNIDTAVKNQRLSIMGVDEDEEGMDLLKYQQAYSLSSKIMSVMAQVYDKLINETGI